MSLPGDAGVATGLAIGSVLQRHTPRPAGPKNDWDSMDAVEIYAHNIPDAYRPQVESILRGLPIDTLSEIRARGGIGTKILRA